MKRSWLMSYSWPFVTAQNALLCAAKNALHKRTSDGHDSTKKLWESIYQQEMRLDEAVAIKWLHSAFTMAIPLRRLFVMLLISSI
jgi:hypothetical protein